MKTIYFIYFTKNVYIVCIYFYMQFYVVCVCKSKIRPGVKLVRVE